MSTARRYLKKKLPYFQVQKVILRRRHEDIVMRPILDVWPDGVPEGCYCLGSGTVLLPERKRGDKYVVLYTTLHEAIL